MNTAKRFFYVVYPPEGAIKTFLDAIVLVARPQTRHSAHITIRGPYDQPIDVKQFSDRIQGKFVRVSDVGRFFESSQNTVFFHCSCPDFLSIWDKLMGGYVPHVTLYDGPDRGFAEALLDVVERHLVRLAFRATGLETLVSDKSDPRSSLRERYDPIAVGAVLGETLALEDIDALDTGKRLAVIDRLVRHLATTPKAAISA